MKLTGTAMDPIETQPRSPASGGGPGWAAEGITLYHADCLDVLPFLSGIDAVIADPPYGDKTHKGARSLSVGDDLKSHRSINFESVDSGFLRNVFGLCSPRRWLISFIEWQHCLPLESFPPVGLEFIRFGVWTKLNPMP